MNIPNHLVSQRQIENLTYYGDSGIDSARRENADEIHLRHYLERVFRHKWIVAIVTVAITSAAALFIFGDPDVYKAQARIQVDLENNSTLATRAKDPSPFDDRAYFNTQLELLESPGLIQRVVKKLKLDTNADFASEGFLEADNWRTKMRRTASFITGDERDKSDSLEKAAGPKSFVSVVKAVQNGVSIEPVVKARQTIKDTRLISINFYHPKPEMSVMISNAIADELVASNLAKRLHSNNTENDFLQTNIAELKSQIRGDEEKLLAYGRNFQLPSQDSSQNTVVERLVGLNKNLLEAENARKLAEAEYQAAKSPGAAAALAETGAKQITDIDSRLDELRQKRAQLLVEATEKYPEVIETDRQISVLENQSKAKREQATALFTTNLDTKYRQAIARENSVRNAFNRQRGETLGQNEAAINYRIIQQGLETNKGLLDDMSKREQENQMLKAKAPNNIHVIDYAMTPSDPIDPKRIQYFGVALLFSLTLGVGLALLRDYFDDSVHTSEEVEKSLSLPALAVIPHVSGRSLRSLGAKNAGDDSSVLHITGGDAAAINGEPELLFNADVHSPLAEAFRRLRTALLLSPAAARVKKILVTSSRQSEGKTTTAVNIATSLAQTGAKVLLIDADLRSPRIHHIFGLSNYGGLSDVFSRDLEHAELFHSLIVQCGSLHVLPAGSTPLNSAECLGSDRMVNLLNRLEPAFDYIVIDSPPVVNFVDSTILSTMVDGVLFVVQGNRSSREMVRSSTKILKMVGAKIIGVVLNKVAGPKQSHYRPASY